MYIRYIHKLCDMHLQAENYTGMLMKKASTFKISPGDALSAPKNEAK